MASSPQFGQEVLDSFTVLSVVTSHVDSSLHHQIAALFPLLVAAIQSRFAVVRRSAARAIAVVCDVATVEGLRGVVQMVLPLLGDPTTSKRQGAIEVVSRASSFIFHDCVPGSLIQRLCLTSPDLVKAFDTKILPYVLFMIVPVLGRMSDPDDDVRHLATSTFASLVKTVPLEVSPSTSLLLS
jgi:TATA-binding protein-associated factor